MILSSKSAMYMWIISKLLNMI